MANWKTLTRSDLKAFDEDMTKFILYAMDNGGTGRVSNNGHAIIRNNSGQTMSVSRSSSGGSRMQNVARDITRLFGAPGTVEQPRTAGTSALAAVPDEKSAPSEIIRCIAKGCAETFVTEGGRYAHVEQSHFRCREDGCNAAFTTPQGVAGHRRIVHEGHKPRKGRGPKQMAAAKTTEPPLPVQPETPPAPESAKPEPEPAPDVVHDEAVHYDAMQVLERVREALGDDPRVATLQERVAQQQRTIDGLIRERDDLKAQLGIIREALSL